MNLLRLLAGTTLLSLAAALPAAAVNKTESRDVTGFTGIALAAPILVELVLGDKESLTLEGDERALAVLETVVEGDSLRIRIRRGAREWTSNWPNADKVRAKVTARSIKAVSIHGSGDIRSPQLSGDALAVQVSGSGDVKIGGGKVKTLSVNISGSGDVAAGRLEAQAVSVSIAGSGDATVWAKGSLAVKVAGSGDVGYYGDPTVAKSIAGSGDIKRLGASPG